MFKRSGLLVIMLLFSAGLMAGVRAQSSTVGNISGNVRDPNGAIVPKAEIVIQEESTATSRRIVADDK